ncbi:MAG: DUF4263 domain-containing protein [Polyangiales bacterium]
MDHTHEITVRLPALSPSPEVRHAAAKVVRDIFAEATVNADAFRLVGQFFHRHTMMSGIPGTNVDQTEVMAMFAESSIKLSRSVLEDMARLVASEEVEEVYQRFLTKNPVLLDPLAAEVVPKQRLGSEYATDFAIRRHDDRWILVEVERPHDVIFTKKNDFSHRFTHAFGQVLDFQSWVDSNVAYAEKLMHRIVAPRGLLVMGLRRHLTDYQRDKLRRFADNSHRIEVITYDDLVDRAESLYASLHGIDGQER